MGARSLSVSEEFRQFTWGVEHKMSSTYYPQSNGLAENGVKIVKRLHRKAADRGDDAYLALLAYTGRQPTEEMMPTSPCLRIPLHPSTVESLRPSYSSAERSERV